MSFTRLPGRWTTFFFISVGYFLELTSFPRVESPPSCVELRDGLPAFEQRARGWSPYLVHNGPQSHLPSLSSSMSWNTYSSFHLRCQGKRQWHGCKGRGCENLGAVSCLTAFFFFIVFQPSFLFLGTPSRSLSGVSGPSNSCVPEALRLEWALLLADLFHL